MGGRIFSSTSNAIRPAVMHEMCSAGFSPKMKRVEIVEGKILRKTRPAY
jgi:hypothetical protein